MGGRALQKQKELNIHEDRPLTAFQRTIPILLSLVYFGIVCLSSAGTIKTTALSLVALTIVLAVICFARLRDRFTPVLLALSLVVILDGISTLYAASGKFALYEFLKVLISFCLALILLSIAPGNGTSAGRWVASILAGCSAVAGLVSVDLISTRVISNAVFELLGKLTSDYTALDGVEPGVRMTSLFSNPNAFAGIVGLGTLLSLGLVMSSQTKLSRCLNLVCLYVNALSFVLAISMGGTAMIAVAFLIYLLLERKERRAQLFTLMAETLVLTLVSAAAVSATSFTVWESPRPVPLLCMVLGSAALCAADFFLTPRVTGRISRKTKGVAFLILGLVALLAVFVLLAWNITGAAELSAESWLRRAAYPEPGEYTLSVSSDNPLSVVIESQNQQDTMMHTSSQLYSGPAEGAVFTVPEDSLVVYFNFYAGDNAVRIEDASYSGAADGGHIPLKYLLLPGFIANRLQGLFANQNAIQRVVFFADGIKLFKRAPLFGRGMGAFENGIKSVQSFYYETKYAHNHYIQILTETGIVGLVLFLGLLALSAISIWRKLRRDGERTDAIIPALGGALVFMAGHAAVEVVFSFYAYLPIAFGVFAAISLSTSEKEPLKKGEKITRTSAVAACAVLIAGFGILLYNNLRAADITAEDPTREDLVKAASLDRFEYADYMLRYVLDIELRIVEEPVQRQADEFAEQLSEIDSNTIPYYLADYYFSKDQTENGLRMVEKYVRYTASDPDTWQRAFNLLRIFENGTESYRAAVVEIADLMDEWNAENIGKVTVDENAMKFIAKMRG